MKLQFCKGRYYRIKTGQTARAVEEMLSCPVNSCFAGAVVSVEKCSVYTVAPFETYQSIAKKLGVMEETLKNFNGCRPIYPFCKIYIPCP